MGDFTDDDDWDLAGGTSPYVPADDTFVPDESVEDDE